MDGPVLNVPLGAAFGPLFQPYEYKALYGGRGTAKSYGISTALAVITSEKRKRVVCGRQFQNSIRDSSKSTIEGRIKALGYGKDFNVTHNEIVNRWNESRFTFVGLERNKESIKSLDDVDIFWIEEARNVSENSLEILVPTIRKPGAEIWASWNPVSPDDPIDKFFRGAHPPRNSYIRRVSVNDNPWFYTTRMPADMERMKLANYRRYKHIWLGEYDELDDSRIFNNWRKGRLETTENDRPHFGLDFGFSGDPSAFIKLFVFEKTKQIYITAEAYGTFTLGELPIMMDTISQSRKFPIIADSSRPEDIAYLRTKGFDVIASKKGNGSVRTGINWLLGYDIVISPECVNMLDEARLYSWQTDKLTNKVLPIVMDSDNHGWDAVRYATEQARDNRKASVKRFKF
jgi:phage terminase large subunit